MKFIVTIAAALAITAALLAMAAPAVTRDATSVGDVSTIAKIIEPKAAMMTISAGGTSGESAIFTVPYSAKVYGLGSIDYGAVSKFNKPLQGSFDIAKGTGRMTWDSAFPATAVIDYANNSSIPVAGTNAIMAMQDFNVTPAGNDSLVVEFSKVTIYLPNGTANTYKLDQPVRISYRLDQMSANIEANPTFTGIMAGLFRAGAVFPAGAKPVKLNDILAAKQA